jgi:stress-induced-phosphoprotein 1
MRAKGVQLTCCRAYARIGTAYEKQNDLANAVLFYQKAQTEHRTPEVLAKLRAAEKAKIKAERDSYINPEEAEKARELGNAKFKEADWPAAVEAYSEMIKRAPDDPRGYSNRAACFIKLLAFPSAIQDCDEAIKRDVKFIRAYLRKAQAYFVMKEYNKCINTCAEAMEHDEGGKNAREIQQQESKALQAQYSARDGESEQETMERIQRDPEVSQLQQSPLSPSTLPSHPNANPFPSRSPASSRTPSCRASCSKPRTTPPRCRSISRTRASGPRSRSWCTPV